MKSILPVGWLVDVIAMFVEGHAVGVTRDQLAARLQALDQPVKAAGPGLVREKAFACHTGLIFDLEPLLMGVRWFGLKRLYLAGPFLEAGEPLSGSILVIAAARYAEVCDREWTFLRDLRNEIGRGRPQGAFIPTTDRGGLRLIEGAMSKLRGYGLAVDVIPHIPALHAEIRQHRLPAIRRQNYVRVIDAASAPLTLTYVKERRFR